jgi:Protein of unknown function (DUF2905)
MDLSSLGKAIVIVGAVLILTGGLIWLLGRSGLPLGRLPGDLHIQREGMSCYVPIVSMIVVSILLTIVLNVVIRLLNR